MVAPGNDTGKLLFTQFEMLQCTSSNARIHFDTVGKFAEISTIKVGPSKTA